MFTNDEDIRQFITNECLFSHEVAQMLNISPQRLHQLVQAGKLRPVKKSAKSSLFLRSDVEQRLAELRQANRQRKEVKSDEISGVRS